MIKILAINDDTDTCQKCGKTNLKRVMWLQVEDGEPVAYGVDCAAKALGLDGKFSAKDAERVQALHAEKTKRQAKFEKACQDAQGLANKMQEPVCVCLYRGEYFTRREKVNQGEMYTPALKTFMPA